MVFCTVDRNRPAAPVVNDTVIVLLMASFGSKGTSSSGPETSSVGSAIGTRSRGEGIFEAHTINCWTLAVAAVERRAVVAVMMAIEQAVDGGGASLRLLKSPQLQLVGLGARRLHLARLPAAMTTAAGASGFNAQAFGIIRKRRHT